MPLSKTKFYIACYWSGTEESYGYLLVRRNPDDRPDSGQVYELVFDRNKTCRFLKRETILLKLLFNGYSEYKIYEGTSPAWFEQYGLHEADLVTRGVICGRYFSIDNYVQLFKNIIDAARRKRSPTYQA